MPNFLMMNGATVENVIVADKKESAEHALGCVLIEVPDDLPVWVGWRLIDGVWVEPEQTSSEEGNG